MFVVAVDIPLTWPQGSIERQSKKQVYKSQASLSKALSTQQRQSLQIMANPTIGKRVNTKNVYVHQ